METENLKEPSLFVKYAITYDEKGQTVSEHGYGKVLTHRIFGESQEGHERVLTKHGKIRDMSLDDITDVSKKEVGKKLVSTLEKRYEIAILREMVASVRRNRKG